MSDQDMLKYFTVLVSVIAYIMTIRNNPFKTFSLDPDKDPIIWQIATTCICLLSLMMIADLTHMRALTGIAFFSCICILINCAVNYLVQSSIPKLIATGMILICIIMNTLSAWACAGLNCH